MKRNLFLTIVMLGLLPLAAAAGIVVQEYEFTQPQLVPEFNGDIAVMESCRTTGQPGAPALPTYGVRLLLPPGETAASIRVVAGQPQVIRNVDIAPNQVEIPFSFTEVVPVIPAAAEIYTADTLYPASLYSETLNQFYRGHSLAFFQIHPVRYNPVQRELWWYPHLRVEVTTTGNPEAAASFNQLYRHDAATSGRLGEMVDNISLLADYPDTPSDRIADYDMVIVTNSALEAFFQTLADFNSRRGIHTFVETIEWIYANIDGVDNQDRIRNYIIDCYQNLNIQYALLGGDGDASGGGNIIPRRGVYATTHYSMRETDPNLPCDLYYGGLDGNWNSDGDGQYGEENPEEADFIAEVHVGRAAVDNAAEAVNFVNKHMAYQQSPVTADCDEVLLAGELLWDDDGGTWTFGRTYMEELRLGSSNHGYTTFGIDNPALVDTLYDQYTFYPGEWSPTSHLSPRLNAGVNYLNHLGHCNYNYMARYDLSDMTTSNFTNDGINHGFYIVYSQGCICGEFDTDDCISEHWTTHISTGAVAIVSNSNYGWGYHYSTRGSSQYFDREFVDAIYGEDITSIARANDDSKADCLPWITGDDMANRWCALELNLFGDPSLDIWTAEPATLTANFNDAYIIGTGFFDVEVPGVAGALVALSFDGELVGRGYTNGLGNVQLTLDPAPVVPGTMELVVTAHNYFEYSGTVSVIPPSGPYVVYNGCVVEDENGELNPGEMPQLTIAIRNVGVEAALGVDVTLTTQDAWVSILDGSEYYGDLAPDETVTILEGYQVSVSPDTPENHLVHFEVTAVDGRETWLSSFDLMVLYIYEQYWSYDCETAGGWTHEAADGWSDQWHLSLEQYQSPVQSWKCGDTGTGNYANLLDARLISAPLELRPYSRLSFQQQMDGEISGAYPDSAYDGGICEISTDDGITWIQLQPMIGGYNKSFRWEAGGEVPATHPFIGGTPCWSGSFTWQTTEISLADYAGETVRFRFRFGSDQGGGGEGWYLDDFALVGVAQGGLQPVTDLTISTMDTSVFLSWSPSQGAVSYNVYYCDTPYGEYQFLGNTNQTQWTGTLSGSGGFYRVTALDQ